MTEWDGHVGRDSSVHVGRACGMFSLSLSRASMRSRVHAEEAECAQSFVCSGDAVIAVQWWTAVEAVKRLWVESTLVVVN